MKTTKLDISTMQDLHHHALAMMGSDTSKFDSRTLTDRLAACQRVYEILAAAVPGDALGSSREEIERFKEVINNADAITSVKDLERLGRLTLKLVKAWGNRNLYDTCRGCRV